MTTTRINRNQVREGMTIDGVAIVRIETMQAPAWIGGEPTVRAYFADGVVTAFDRWVFVDAA